MHIYAAMPVAQAVIVPHAPSINSVLEAFVFLPSCLNISDYIRSVPNYCSNLMKMHHTRL